MFCSTASGAVRSSAANQLWKVRICTGRPVASRFFCKLCSALRRSGVRWSIISSEIPRIRSCSAKSSSGVWANSASHSCRRARISPAAFLVKVMAKISWAGQPSSKARTMRDTSIHVLPAPAQASTATLRRGSQAMA